MLELFGIDEPVSENSASASTTTEQLFLAISQEAITGTEGHWTP